MAVRSICLIGDPVLRERASDIDPDTIASDETQQLIDDLIDTMRDASGAGIAAPQIGISKRVCVLEVNNNPRYPYKPSIPLTVLINPELTPLTTDTFSNYEGCLSVPNLRGRVDRHMKLNIKAFDRTGKAVEFIAAGIEAGTYAHEVDHLDGVLFVDRVTDPTTLCTWDNFKAHYEADFIQLVHEVEAVKKEQP